MPLNPQQSEAVKYLDGPLLVIAGPGTGKTQLLSSKVAYILENTDASPDSILCLTFTESAATNMRERLLSVIGPSANSVNIFTYHSFGNFLLSEYQNFKNNPIRLFENSISNVESYHIIESLKEKLPAFNPLKSADTKDLIDTIKDIKSARLTPLQLENIYANNQQIINQINQSIPPILSEIPPRAKFDLALEKYQQILQILDDISKNFTTINNIPPLSESIFNSLKSSFENINPQKPSIAPLSDWRKKHFTKNADDQYQLNYNLANAKLIAVKELLSQYSNLLSEQNLFDFSDMIEETINALKSDDAFKLTISEHFQYIMLDEFQDTNPSQFELVKLITDYEKPNIMAVGDDDQAIFEFQGANASNFQIFHNHYNAHIITLTKNYRSTAPILELSHNIAEQISDRFCKLNNFNKNLSSFLSDNTNLPTDITRHEFKSSDAEYFWVANEVDKLIKQGIDPNEIAIIAPKHKFIAPILPYFKNFPHIPISYERRDNLFLDPLISNIIIIAGFIKSLTNNTPPNFPLLQILSLPFFNISHYQALLTVHQLPKNTPLIELAKSDIPEIKSLFTFLLDLSANFYTLPLDTFLNQLLGITQNNSTNINIFNYFTDNQSDPVKVFHFYENLLVLTEQIKAYFPPQTMLSADHLLNFASDYQLANEPLVNTSPYQNSAQAVQLLSVHKSKGLEFSHVFLISADDISWGKAKGNNNKLVLPPNLKSIRHTGDTNNEKLRVFFVAITRAKTHLYITNSTSNFNGKTIARLNYLNEAPSIENKSIINSPFIPNKTITLHQESSPTSTDLTSRWSNTYDINQPDIKQLIKNRIKNFRLSASSFTDFFDIIYSGPQVFYEKYLLPSIKPPISDSQIYGTSMHKTLDYAVKNQVSLASAQDFYQNSINALPDYNINKPYLLEKGLTSLEIFYDNHQSILKNPHAKTEINFSDQKIFLNKTPITGVIDYISENPISKTIEIYDYKTGKAKNVNWDSDHNLFKYKQQLIFYKFLLNSSNLFRNHKIEYGHILFITPDEELKIHQKTLYFTPEDEKFTSDLIQKIYQLIINLDFIDNSELFIPPNENANLSTMKQFINKILDI